MTDDSAIRRFREAFALVDKVTSGPLRYVNNAKEAALALVHVPGCLCRSGESFNPRRYDDDCTALREKLRGEK